MLDLNTTQVLSPEALNNARLASMLQTLQTQRDALANEVVNVRSEQAQIELKLASEIQVARSSQVQLAELRRTLSERIEELKALKDTLCAERLAHQELVSELETVKYQNQRVPLISFEVPRAQLQLLASAAELVKCLPNADTFTAVIFNQPGSPALTTTDISLLT